MYPVFEYVDVEWAIFEYLVRSIDRPPNRLVFLVQLDSCSSTEPYEYRRDSWLHSA
jgi:hypothetical protein